MSVLPWRAVALARYKKNLVLVSLVGMNMSTIAEGELEGPLLTPRNVRLTVRPSSMMVGFSTYGNKL